MKRWVLPLSVLAGVGNLYTAFKGAPTWPLSLAAAVLCAYVAARAYQAQRGP